MEFPQTLKENWYINTNEDKARENDGGSGREREKEEWCEK